MTPEQEEQVRRALAAAARAEDRADTIRPDGDTQSSPGPHRTPGPDDTGDHRTPLPADVAARLDAALEDLLAPRVTTAASTGGDELARRRRRRWPTGLIAAAALCLVALAGGAAVIRGFGPTNESNSSSTSADRSTSDSGSAGELSGDDSSADSGSRPAATPGGRSPAPSAATSGPRELAATGASPTFRTETLARDIRRLLDLPGALPTGEPPAWRCVAPPLAAGEQLVGVRLDGRRSSLVLGAPTGGQRSARLYSCADPRILVASTTVPTPDR